MARLYSARICPFAHRARLALREKGVPFEEVEIDLRAMPDWYLELSPNRKVPLLQREDGALVWESAIIAEYVDEAFEGPQLMPADPLERARVRLAVESGTRFIPHWYKVLRGGEPEELTALLDEMEQRPEGPYWMGSQATLADLLIFPWFERFGVLEHYRQLELARWPRLAAWTETMRGRAASQAETVGRDDYVEAYLPYAENRR